MSKLLLDEKVCGADLSQCGRYRYRLWRRWDARLPTMLWVMLNPSTADASADDPTIRKCVGFAKRHDCGGIVVVNLFAWRATDPKELERVSEPVGPENDRMIQFALVDTTPNVIVAGWGGRPFARRRAGTVKRLLAGYPVKRLSETQDGAPGHPLFIPYDTPLLDWKL